MAARVNDNKNYFFFNVQRKAKSYNEIPDNNGKIFSLPVEQTKLFVHHLFSLWKEVG